MTPLHSVPQAPAPRRTARGEWPWGVWLVIGILSAALYLEGRPAQADEPAETAPAAKKNSPELDARIRALVIDLSADDFATREKASRELARIGAPARAALEAAAQDDENSEAQWRARQILRRIAGQTARPMGDGRDDVAPRPPAPGAGNSPWGPVIDERFEELRRRLQRLTEGLEAGRFGTPWNTSRRGVYEVEGLRLENRLGMVLLHVSGQDGAEDRQYRGWSLEYILRRHPELKKHPSLPALKEKLKKDDPFAAFEDFMKRHGASGGIRLLPGARRHQGLEITQGPNGTRVVVRDRDEAGEPRERVFEGESLDAIKKAHPELETLLEKQGLPQLRIQIGGVDPRRPFGAPLTPRRRAEPFGVYPQAVSETLAFHLDLPPGQGALVRHVLRASPAERLGLRRSDIVLAVGETPVTDWQRLDRLLREHWDAKDKALTVEIIRRGKRTTLERPAAAKPAGK